MLFILLGNRTLSQNLSLKTKNKENENQKTTTVTLGVPLRLRHIEKLHIKTTEVAANTNLTVYVFL